MSVETFFYLKTISRVVSDVLFVVGLAFFFYLMHKKEKDPPGRIPKSEWPLYTDRVLAHKEAKKFFMTCVNSRRKGADLLEKLEWENYFDEITRTKPDITWQEILEPVKRSQNV